MLPLGPSLVNQTCFLSICVVACYNKHHLLIASEVLACSFPFLWWRTNASVGEASGIRPNSSIQYSNDYVTFFFCSLDIFGEAKKVPGPWCLDTVDSVWNNRNHPVHSCQTFQIFTKGIHLYSYRFTIILKLHFIPFYSSLVSLATNPLKLL